MYLLVAGGVASNDWWMRIVAVAAPGSRTLLSAALPHGTDPHLLLSERGFRVRRLLSATRVDGEIVVTAEVFRRRPKARPRVPGRVRTIDLGVDIELGQSVPKRQRVAAYAIVLSDLGILATQFSHRTAVPGLWGLPGGGVDADEQPGAAVLREIGEETGQEAIIDHILDLQTDHWIGRSPSGEIEDFHAVRIIYAAFCQAPTTPIVHDIGGTTASTRWIRLSNWRRTQWSAGFRMLLDRHLDALTANTRVRRSAS